MGASLLALAKSIYYGQKITHFKVQYYRSKLVIAVT